MKPITVFTPTYNRAYCLHQVYDSLCNQTNTDFVWMIIDDGSSDNTKQIVQTWINENKIEIKYIYQNNQGMHGAHNAAYKNITTELNTCIDSDDFMPINAIEEILNFWDSIENKNQYAGILGLDIDKNNNVIGTLFNENIKETTLSGFYESGGKGDKKVVYRTDIINKYPEYPLFEGEKYVSLGYKYLLIDQDYKLATINKPLVVVEYLTDGSSLNMFSQYRKNPKGFAFIRIVNMKYTKSYLRKVKECIHYIACNLLSKKYNFLSTTPLKTITFLSIPFGILMYLLILYKTKK